MLNAAKTNDNNYVLGALKTEKQVARPQHAFLPTLYHAFPAIQLKLNGKSIDYEGLLGRLKKIWPLVLSAFK